MQKIPSNPNPRPRANTAGAEPGSISANQAGQPGQAWAPPPPPRPGSPTYVRLKSLADQEKLGQLVVPAHPAVVRRATVDEWTSIKMFRENMMEADPTGNLRMQGEFFQTFSAKPEEMDFFANHPIHYQPGSAINAPPPGSFPPETVQIVHSHPPPPPGHISSFPSAQDYLGTYQINEGNARHMGGIMYHAGEDQAYAFTGKIDPETQAPEFHRLLPSGMQELNQWFEQHHPEQLRPKPNPHPSQSPRRNAGE